MDHSAFQVLGIAGRCRNRGLPAARTGSSAGRHARPSVQISLFRGVGLHVDGREVALSGRKAQALIAYLVLTPGMKATREQLVGLLWSEAEDAKARASLRQLLHVLRVTFERAGVVGLSIDKLRVS